MTPEKWIDLLYLYGPMALFAFMVFVLLGKAKSNEGLSNEQRRIQAIAYMSVWTSIFVLAIVIVVFWWRINLPDEFEIRGIIHNLQDPEVISTRDDLFLKRKYKAGRDFDYEWRVISTRPISESIAFLLQTDPKSAEALRYEIPIKKDFYKGFVEITYDRDTGKMTLKHGSDHDEMLPKREEAKLDYPSAQILVKQFDVLYASDDSGSLVELAGALDSSDPVIRQNARRSLIANGSASLSVLQGAFTNPGSSERLKTEVLSTLNGMATLNSQALKESTACAILQAANDSSRPILRREAVSLVLKGVHGGTTCAVTLHLSVDQHSTRTTIRKANWHPSDLAYDPSSGLFVLDRQGVISRISIDSNGLGLDAVFRLPQSFAAGSIAVTPDAVLVTGNAGAGCTVFRYSLLSKSLSPRLISANGSSCAGIAVSGTATYVLLAGLSNEIKYWNRWDDEQFISWPLSYQGPFVYLGVDLFGNRLLAASSTGYLYAISVSDGKGRQIASDVGWVNSIAINKDHVFLASGKKILSVSRSGDRREATPKELQKLTGGSVSGTAFDSAGRLWFADYDHGVVEGPVHLE